MEERDYILGFNGALGDVSVEGWVWVVGVRYGRSIESRRYGRLRFTS